MRFVVCEGCGERSPPDTLECTSCGATTLRSVLQVSLTPTPALLASRPAIVSERPGRLRWLIALVALIGAVALAVALAIWGG